MSSFDLARFESEWFDLSSALKAYGAKYQEVDPPQKARILGVSEEIEAYMSTEEFQSKCVLHGMTTRLEELESLLIRAE
jgi:hypothetical protein